ncbi:proton channel OtopLc-like [Cylas formicarius]|uniref:proton channel OtopLc-like n=1 Tax=Cylas formicarius TaxID=197179 RepID=UPI002958353B|nr:proton channel OtopLc-like [Cylas formicarius]
MDILHEENSCRELRKVGFTANDIRDASDDESENTRVVAKKLLSVPADRDHNILQTPHITLHANECVHRCCDSERRDSSALSSRRPSAIIAALRRPSQTIALSAAHAVMNQKKYLMDLFNESTSSAREEENEERKEWRRNKKLGNDRLTVILSILYAKFLVVLGIAFPISEVISSRVGPFFYQGFYLYLYFGSMTFIIYEYASCVRERAVKEVIKNYRDNEKGELLSKANDVKRVQKYGSFYLRLGATAFGIGSMVYSGLEFGRYFELQKSSECPSSPLQAITPATRMLLTLLQVQFIFLNHKDVDINRHKIIARFGLMHMIATNVCEWLYVLVEETKHEINHLEDHDNYTNNTTNQKYCLNGRLIGSLITDASPFLFPCTIEYSLICAVILFEMWKHLQHETPAKGFEQKKRENKHRSDIFSFPTSTSYHFTIDCSNSHKGLFAGITVIVLTIISLVMFFVLSEPEGVAASAENTINVKRPNYAELEVNVVELFLYIITTVAIIFAMYRLRDLKYDRKIGEAGVSGIGLDNTLLAVSQTGMYIYSIFSIIGWYFTINGSSPVGMVADIFSLVQTGLQTMFVLDGWWRRCRNIEQAKKKPGKQLITFLIIANLAMWTINTLEKNRAEFRPTHLNFFGDSAWTIITHISMPLAIFYRFHSTICLFEIWKNAYKIKSNFKNPLFPVM